MSDTVRTFKIVDILHTGHHGPKGESKRGFKYDRRRGKVFRLDMTSLKLGESLVLPPIISWTTPFEKFFYDGIYYHIVTLNSEYIVDEI